MKAGFTFLFNGQGDLWTAQALMDYLTQSFPSQPKADVMMGDAFLGAADALDNDALAAIPKSTILKIVADMDDEQGSAFGEQVNGMQAKIRNKNVVFALVVEPSPYGS